MRKGRKKENPFLLNILGAMGFIVCLFIIEVRMVMVAGIGFIINGTLFSRGIYLGIVLLYTVLSLLEISRRRKAGIAWDANLKNIERLNPKSGLAVLNSADKVNGNKVSYKTALIALTNANIPLEEAIRYLEDKKLEIEVDYITNRLRSPKVSTEKTTALQTSLIKDFEKVEVASKQTAPPSFSEDQGFQPVDINHALDSEIAKLPRINLILAKKIIGIRERLGGFVSFDQFVQEVNLSESIVEAIQDQVIFTEIKHENQSSKGRIIDY